MWFPPPLQRLLSPTIPVPGLSNIHRLARRTRPPRWTFQSQSLFRMSHACHLSLIPAPDLAQQAFLFDPSCTLPTHSYYIIETPSSAHSSMIQLTLPNLPVLPAPPAPEIPNDAFWLLEESEHLLASSSASNGPLPLRRRESKYRYRHLPPGVIVQEILSWFLLDLTDEKLVGKDEPLVCFGHFRTALRYPYFLFRSVCVSSTTLRTHVICIRKIHHLVSQSALPWPDHPWLNKSLCQMVQLQSVNLRVSKAIFLPSDVRLGQIVVTLDRTFADERIFEDPEKMNFRNLTRLEIRSVRMGQFVDLVDATVRLFDLGDLLPFVPLEQLKSVAGFCRWKMPSELLRMSRLEKLDLTFGPNDIPYSDWGSFDGASPLDSVFESLKLLRVAVAIQTNARSQNYLGAYVGKVMKRWRIPRVRNLCLLGLGGSGLAEFMDAHADILARSVRSFTSDESLMRWRRRVPGELLKWECLEFLDTVGKFLPLVDMQAPDPEFVTDCCFPKLSRFVTQSMFKHAVAVRQLTEITLYSQSPFSGFFCHADPFWNLKKLAMGGFRVTEDGSVLELSRMPLLEILWLDGCEICASELSIFLKNVSKTLRELALRGCEGLVLDGTSHSWFPPWLRSLLLAGNDLTVSDEFFRGVRLFQHLRRMSLAVVTPQRKWTADFPSLLELIVVGCDISDAVFANRFPMLRILNLNQVATLSGRRWSVFPELVNLTIQNTAIRDCPFQVPTRFPFLSDIQGNMPDIRFDKWDLAGMPFLCDRLRVSALIPGAPPNQDQE